MLVEFDKIHVISAVRSASFVIAFGVPFQGTGLLRPITEGVALVYDGPALWADVGLARRELSSRAGACAHRPATLKLWESATSHQQPATRNQEPGTGNQEPGTRNQEPGTSPIPPPAG